VDRFELAVLAERLAPGGYEVFFESSTIELGVYVLAAPDPDLQEPHDRDEVYVVLEGSGTLTVADERTELDPGDGAFVAAGTEHRFSAYERLTLLVLFDNTTRAGA
jgi:mannose-6-phosphate isomerase-like protein (cupin superfamily)